MLCAFASIGSVRLRWTLPSVTSCLDQARTWERIGRRTLCSSPPPAPPKLSKATTTPKRSRELYQHNASPNIPTPKSIPETTCQSLDEPARRSSNSCSATMNSRPSETDFSRTCAADSTGKDTRAQKVTSIPFGNEAHTA